MDNTATVKITKTGSDKTNRPPVIVWANLCLTGTNECYKPPRHLSRELKKIINPDTKHTFTAYSLFFFKGVQPKFQTGTSSGTGISGKRENAIWLNYIYTLPTCGTTESIPKYELTYNCRIMTNSRLVRSRLYWTVTTFIKVSTFIKYRYILKQIKHYK